MSSALPMQESNTSSAPRSLSSKVSSMRFMQRAQDAKSAPKPPTQSNSQSNKQINTQSTKPSKSPSPTSSQTTNQSTKQQSTQPASQTSSSSPTPSTSQSSSQPITPIIISAARRECSTEPMSVQSSLGRRSFGAFNKHLEPQPPKEEAPETLDTFMNSYDNPDDMPRKSKKFSGGQSNNQNDQNNRGESRPSKKRKTGSKLR